MKIWRCLFFLFLSFSFFTGTIGLKRDALSGRGVDNGLYAQLLKQYVKNGVVDYQGFKNEEAKLDQYLTLLERTAPKTLTRNDQVAFYVNAYNAWTIKLVLSGYPGVKSIKDLGSLFKSPWKKKICRIDGGVITLDDIEHDILRPRFKDPRVHFAVNCASKSCPPLQSEPYEGSILDQQLDGAAQAFINDPRRNRLDGKTLYVSKIFDWFEEDFNDDVFGFFLKYARGDLKKQLEANRANITIKYLNYDWSLNGM